MGPHTYWRLSVSEVNDATYVSGVQFRTTIGGANAATGGTASALRAVIGSAAAAFSGGSWGPGATGPVLPWLQYAFAAPTTILEVAFSVGSVANSRSTALLAFSDDGISFKYVAPAMDVGTLGAKVYTLSDTTNPRIYGAVLRQAPGWPAGPVGARALGAALRHDAVDGGPYRIEGVTEREVSTGVFAVYPQRRVRLFERLTGRLVRSTWSDAVTGAYSFGALKLTEYIVVTDDWSRYYNAVAADAIVPVL